jgi:hypothetical protein
MPFYDSIPSAQIPEWLAAPQRDHNITRVVFTEAAQQQLQTLTPKLQFYANQYEEVKAAIEEVLCVVLNYNHHSRVTMIG